MASYISSNAERFYTALESTYGAVGTITAANRFPAVKLGIQQLADVAQRKDKTGSRTYPGTPSGVRRKTTYSVQTYLTSWDKNTTEPGYGPLLQSAIGGTPAKFTGGTVATSTAAGRVGFTAAHGLTAGQAVCSNGEIRFASAIVDTQTIQLNTPFQTQPQAGATLTAAVTYSPASTLPSVSLFDYWSPATAVQRLLTGAGVDQLDILINGDYHELHFKGVARDVIDSSSFESGLGQLSSFPAEPAVAGFDYSIVPGNMGQAWLGSESTQFCTITSASVTVNNGLDVRDREFGVADICSVAKALAPGERTVTAQFSLYALDDDATKALYQAARQRSPISVMFQLGSAEGQLMGVYLKSVVPEVPEYDDGQNRLQWQFRASRAQGTVDDEIYLAFA
jgi:hypothetical protein